MKQVLSGLSSFIRVFLSEIRMIISDEFEKNDSTGTLLSSPQLVSTQLGQKVNVEVTFTFTLKCTQETLNFVKHPKMHLLITVTVHFKTGISPIKTYQI